MAADLTADDDTACMDCRRVLPEGSPMSSRLIAITGDGTPVAELVCVYCALAPATYALVSLDELLT